MIESVIERIKEIIKQVAPQAKLILFGSQARGDAKEGSDVDLMVILEQQTITLEEERAITTPLYALEFETGKIISPHVITASDWEKAALRTTFYHEVMKDGVILQMQP